MQINSSPRTNSSTSDLRSNGQGNRDKNTSLEMFVTDVVKKGHYKINYPLNKRPKNKGKEIAMTITEALVIESPPTFWWVDSATTRHIARNRELLVDLKEKQLGKHIVYMGKNTYSDVLGEGTYKFSIGDSVIVLNNVFVTQIST